MIDQIRFEYGKSERGTEYERVRVWIAGVPFSADNSAHVEQVVRRLAEVHQIEILDVRRKP